MLAMNKLQIQNVVGQVMREEPDADAIQRVALFGSFVRGDARPDSDVDLLFEMRTAMSLFQIGGIQYRLQQGLGRKVDFVPRESVVPQLKAAILTEAETIYERS